MGVVRAGVLSVVALGAASAACAARPAVELEGERGESAFFVLGMLQEYLGRHVVEGDDRIERFACGEGEKAAIFAAALARFAADQGISGEIRRETEQECQVSFRSRPLARALDSLYDYELTDGIQSMGADGRYHRTGRARVGIAMIAPYGAGAELAFLAGAYARSGDGDLFRFFNAAHKAELVADLLRKHGAREIVVASTWDTLPRVTTVRFRADDALRASLVGYRPRP